MLAEAIKILMSHSCTSLHIQLQGFKLVRTGTTGTRLGVFEWQMKYTNFWMLTLQSKQLGTLAMQRQTSCMVSATHRIQHVLQVWRLSP